MNKSIITRRKWTAEQKNQIIKESLATTGEAVLKKYNISTSVFYKWKKDYMKNYAQKQMRKLIDQSELPSMKLNPIIERIKNIEDLATIRWNDTLKLNSAVENKVIEDFMYMRSEIHNIYIEIKKKLIPRIIILSGISSLIFNCILKFFGI